MQAPRESASYTSFKDILHLSKPFLTLDLSNCTKFSSMGQIIQHIEEKLLSFPYINALDLSDNGFDEMYGPLDHYTDFFTKQANLVLFLAKLPENIQKIRFKDMNIRLDAFWAVYLFNQLQNYAIKLSYQSDNWLSAINQEVWTHFSALKLLDSKTLPKVITLDSIRILEQLCVTTNTSFSLLVASWINKGLIAKHYFQPNKEVAKTYYKQALISFEPEFEKSIIHESQLECKPLVEHGVCANLKTEDDICVFKSAIGKLKPFDILVMSIQNNELIDAIQSVLETISIELYLVFKGSKDIYQKLLPKLNSCLTVYIPESISKDEALDICRHLNPDSSIELSATLDTNIARHIIKHANVRLLAPCALYDIDGLLALNKHTDLIVSTIKSSPHQTYYCPQAFEVLQQRLQHLEEPKNIKLPIDLELQELSELLEILNPQTSILIDYARSFESSIMIIKQQFGIILDKFLHPKQIEYLFSYQLATKISLAEGFPVELAKYTCQQLAHNSRVVLEKHYNDQLVAAIIQEIPPQTAIEVQPGIKPSCLDILASHQASIIIGKNFSPDDAKLIASTMPNGLTLQISNELSIDSAKTLMSYLPLSTEIIPKEDSSEELLQALAQGRQIKFDTTAIAIHSIYQSSKTQSKDDTCGIKLVK